MAVNAIVPAHARRAHPATELIGALSLGFIVWAPVVLWAVGA